MLSRIIISSLLLAFTVNVFAKPFFNIKDFDFALLDDYQESHILMLEKKYQAKNRVIDVADLLHAEKVKLAGIVNTYKFRHKKRLLNRAYKKKQDNNDRLMASSKCKKLLTQKRLCLIENDLFNGRNTIRSLQQSKKIQKVFLSITGTKFHAGTHCFKKSDTIDKLDSNIVKDCGSMPIL